MARLFPFQGYRYDTQQAGPLFDLVTQPYDKIPADLLDQYLGRSPHNTARVIKNPDYREAGKLFHQWISSGILKKDLEPAFYPYQQAFQVEGRDFSRLGFIGLVSLRESDLAIRGHENILDGPLSDRLQLIRETRSNDGLIFTLFSDPEQEVDRLLMEHCRQRPPVSEVVDDFDVINRIWKISDSEVVEQIRRAFATFTLYIADGHHRFETARRFARECEERGWKPGAVESFDKRMMAFFNMEAPGLHIFPTHRAIRNLKNWDERAFLEGLSRDFVIQAKGSLGELRSALPGAGTRIGLVMNSPMRFLLLRLRGSSDWVAGLTEAARRLDVNVLHRGVLERLLAIGPAELAHQSHVDYLRSEVELVGGVRNGDYQLGFLMNPTSLRQVREISEAGEKMPQKSTDFFPKLLTGLVFMKMDISLQGENDDDSLT